MKETKQAVALVVYSQDRSHILQALRPADDEQFPNIWGLVAGNVPEGEAPEDSVRRIAHQKLGVTVEKRTFLGEKTAERERFILTLREYEVRIVDGTPTVPQPFQGMTQYVRLRWETPDKLIEAAQKGSLCSRIFLEHAGISLEG